MSEEEYWIPQEIWSTHGILDQKIDPKLEITFRLAFNYANEMGIKGIKLKDVRYFNGMPDDPLSRTFVFCDRKVEKSERESYDRYIKNQWNYYVGQVVEALEEAEETFKNYEKQNEC